PTPPPPPSCTTAARPLSTSARRTATARRPLVSGDRGWDFVEEAVDAAEAAVLGRDQDVEADHRALAAAGRRQFPGEPRDVVVGVDVADDPEDVTPELAAGGRDERLDGRVPLAGEERVDVAAVLGPQGGDGAAAHLGVRLV